MNLHVLHIGSGNLFGGVETLLITLAKERALCSQMESHFALCFEGRLADELRAAGAEVHMLGNVRIRFPWTVFNARKRLRHLMEIKKFDVVVCHSDWCQVVLGSVVKKFQLPLIFWCHGRPQDCSWLSAWASLILPDLVIANSQYTQSVMGGFYRKVLKEIVYCPVRDPGILDQKMDRMLIRAEFNTAMDTVVIIQVSRLEEGKGQALLISALSYLRDIPGWKCWIVGGAQRPYEVLYLEKLNQQSRESGVFEKIHFLGQRQDVPQLLAAADVFCQSNTGPDAFGIVFIEALYAGLPVVTTAIGGGMEIINETCGKLVPPHDARSLSEALRSLILDPNARRTLGAGGSKRAHELCEPKGQLERLHALFSKMV